MPKRKRHIRGKLCNRWIPKGGFLPCNWTRLHEAFCLVPAGLVGASCMQEGSYGSNESCMQLSITLWIKANMEGLICLINIGMQTSNVQLKQAYRQPLYCEPCEAKDAIKGCMQEASALWIKASMSGDNAQSKDASQACIEEGQKSNRRMWIKEDLLFL